MAIAMSATAPPVGAQEGDGPDAQPTSTAAAPAAMVPPPATPPPAAATGDPAIAGDGPGSVDTELSTIQSLEAAIAAAPTIAAGNVEFERKLVETYQRSIAVLRAAATATQEEASLRVKLETLPAKLFAAQSEANAPPPQAPEINTRWNMIEQVVRARSEAASEVDEVTARLQAIRSKIADRTTKLATLPEQIAEQRRVIEKLRTVDVGEIAGDVGGHLRAARTALQRHEQTAANAKLQWLQRELAWAEQSAQLFPLQLANAERELAAKQKTLQRWSQELGKKRRVEIAQLLQEFSDLLQSAGIDPRTSLLLSIGDRWLDLVDATERTVRVSAQELDLAQRLATQVEENAKQMEAVAASRSGVSDAEGLRLLLLQRKLPEAEPIGARIDRIDESIESLQVLRAQIDLIRDGLLTGALGLDAGLPPPTATDLVNGAGESAAPRTHADMPAWRQRESVLIDRMVADLDENQARQLELRGHLELQVESIQTLRAVIGERLVWLRNQTRFALADILQAWAGLRWLVRPAQLRLVVTSAILGGKKHPATIALLVAALVLLVVLASRIRRRIVTLGNQLTRGRRDRLRPTWGVLLWSIVLASPPSLIMWAIADLIDAGSSAAISSSPEGGRGIGSAAYPPAFADGLRMTAAALLPFELFRQLVRPDGLAVRHFDCDPKVLLGVRRWLRVLIDAGIPAVLICGICESLLGGRLASSTGRVAMVIGLLLAATTAIGVLRPGGELMTHQRVVSPQGWVFKLRSLWAILAATLALGIAAAALAGYESGAVLLIVRLYWTAWLALGLFTIGGLTYRWILHQHRRLAWAVHREKMETAARVGDSPVELPPQPVTGAAEISEQTRRLARTILATAGFIGLLMVWSPVLPAMQILDEVQLWRTTGPEDEIVWVTLRNLLMALPIVILTFASVRNLPGLIESVLLEKLPIDKAARYAITTLASYAIATLGILTAANAVMLRWDSIQWLVAALGVGLGFGLQEIFANFVSGLILLFEQPIRVGDIVTLGDTTGMVSRIRMRATTVTNWDRQELVIPNKDLITGRLINWTLSDSTNRIVINVGVAYASDPDEACDILRQICADHPAVVAEPAPVVTFEGFGDSSLNLVLRCYLSTLDDRLKIVHQLHSMIHRRFKENGVEIPFPQRDLNFKNLPDSLTSSMHSPVAEIYG